MTTKKTLDTFLFFMALSINGFGQEVQIFKTTKALKDSIENKFLKNGAYKYNYFSHSWQKYLDSAIAITPDNAHLWQLKGMPYGKCRKYELSEMYISKAAEIDPIEWLDYKAFMNCIFYKHFNNALIDYDAAEKLKGNYTMMEHPYSFYRSLCYLGLNKFDSALFEMNRTIQTEIKEGGDSHVHFMNWFYKGIILMEQEKYIEAIHDLDKTLNFYHNFSDAQYYKAICLFKLNKTEEAMTLFDEAADNFKKGYSFTEDNAIYEKYPYQLCLYQVQSYGTKKTKK